MSLGLQKIILSGAGSNTPGAFYLTTTIVARDTNTANTVVTAGAYVMPATANIAVQASTDSYGYVFLKAQHYFAILSVRNCYVIRQVTESYQKFAV